MMKRFLLRAGLVSPLAMLIAGCAGPTGAAPRGWVRANLTGETAQSYAGSGVFIEESRGFGQKPVFSIASDAEDASLSVIRLNGDRPSRGGYALDWIDPADPRATGFILIYEQRVGNWSYLYASTSGELTIEESSREAVRGSFRLRAVQYCASERTGTQIGPCRITPTPPENSPTLDVTGTFSVVRDDGTLIDA
jgi:hypothetical protein